MKCWRFFADMTMLSSIQLAGILHKVLPKTYYSLAGNTFLGQPGDFLVLAHSNTFTEYWVIFLLFQFQPTTSHSKCVFSEPTMAKDNNYNASPTGVILYLFSNETHNPDLDKTPPLPFYGRPNHSFSRFVTPRSNHF